MGGIGSGRRPSRIVKVDAATGAIVEQRTLGTVEPASASADPVVTALAEALRDQDRMGATAWVRAALSVDGVETINVYRILPNGTEAKAIVWQRGQVAGEHDDIDARLIDAGGPGTYILKPMRSDVWISKLYSKRVTVGFTGEPDGGIARGTVEDAEAVLASAARRAETANAILQINAVNRKLAAAEKGEESMTAQEMATILEALSRITNQQGSGNQAIDAIMRRLDAIEMKLSEPRASDLSQVIASLTPIVTPLLGKVPRQLISQMVAMLRPERPGPEPKPTLVESLIENLGPLMQQAQPLLAALVQRSQAAHTGPMNTTPNMSAIPAGGPPMPQLQFSDPDTREILDYAVTAIAERRYADALSSFRQSADLGQWLMTVTPGVDPLSLFFGLKTLDARFREMRESCLDFIRYTQEKVAEQLAAVERGEAD